MKESYLKIMIEDLLKFLNQLNLFDIIFSFILIYFIIQCFIKGFTLSLISFMKWVFSTIITIILVPKAQPIVSEYIKSDFINNVGIGIVIFFFCTFFNYWYWKSFRQSYDMDWSWINR